MKKIVVEIDTPRLREAKDHAVRTIKGIMTAAKKTVGRFPVRISVTTYKTAGHTDDGPIALGADFPEAEITD